MGVAHGLGSGHRPGRSACLGSDVRVLLGSSRCADLPPPARGSVLTLSMESVKASLPVAPLVGSDDAEGRRAASRRCGGRAQSCRWHWSLDRGRSDPCWRHQQGSCGPFSCVSAAIEGAQEAVAARVCRSSSPTSYIFFWNPRSSFPAQHHVRKFSAAPILDLQLIAPAIRRLGRHEGTRGSNPEVEIFLFSALPPETFGRSLARLVGRGWRPRRAMAAAMAGTLLLYRIYSFSSCVDYAVDLIGAIGAVHIYIAAQRYIPAALAALARAGALQRDG